MRDETRPQSPERWRDEEVIFVVFLNNSAKDIIGVGTDIEIAIKLINTFPFPTDNKTYTVHTTDYDRTIKFGEGEPSFLIEEHEIMSERDLTV